MIPDAYTWRSIDPAILAAEPHDWVQARHQRLAELTRQEELIRDRWTSGYLSTDELKEKLTAVRHERRQPATDPNWLPERGRRRMPRASSVARYWAEQGEPFFVDVDQPACFGCDTEVSAWGQLERAHLIDRWAGGLDHEANLVMLCGMCHRLMPMFLPGDEDKALAYAMNAGHWWMATAMTKDPPSGLR